MRIANDRATACRLASGPPTSSTAHRFARALRAGTVHVNQYDGDDITVPFGGYKQSRQRPRQVAARVRQVHRTEDHLDADRFGVIGAHAPLESRTNSQQASESTRRRRHSRSSGLPPLAAYAALAASMALVGS